MWVSVYPTQVSLSLRQQLRNARCIDWGQYAACYAITHCDVHCNLELQHFHVIQGKYSISRNLDDETCLCALQTTSLTGCSAWGSPSSMTGSAGTPTPTSSLTTWFALDSCMEVPAAAKWVELNHSEHMDTGCTCLSSSSLSLHANDAHSLQFPLFKVRATHFFSVSSFDITNAVIVSWWKSVATNTINPVRVCSN